MTIYETTIPAGKVSEMELIALIEQINIVTKADVKIEQVFLIKTDNAGISNVLDSLIEAIPQNGNGKHAAAKKNGKAKSEKKSAGMTSHQVRIDATGEVLSRQAFNKRLAAGEVAELTNVTNAKGEQFVVIDRELAKAPQS